MNPRLLPVAAAIFCLLGSPGSAAEAPADLIRAVQNLGSPNDFLVLRRENRQEIRYPGTDQVTDTISSRLVSGGKVLAVKLESSRQGSEEKSAADLSAMQAGAERQLPQRELSYIVPALASTLADFRYDAESRSGAIVSIGFHALRRDDRHADGTITIDTGANRILKIDYIPNIVPKPATEGSGSMTFGEVLPGVWELTREDMHFSGHQFFIKGTADIVITHSHYRKFTTLAAAQKAL